MEHVQFSCRVMLVVPFLLVIDFGLIGILCYDTVHIVSFM